MSSKKSIVVVSVIGAIIAAAAVVALVTVDRANDRVAAVERRLEEVSRLARENKIAVDRQAARPSLVLEDLQLAVDEMRSRVDRGEDVDYADVSRLLNRAQSILPKLSSTQRHALRKSYRRLFLGTPVLLQYDHGYYDMAMMQLGMLGISV